MKFNPPGHIFEVIPMVLDNHNQAKPVKIKTTARFFPEQATKLIDETHFQQEYTPEKALTYIHENSMALARKHFKGIENLTVGETTVETFDEFVALAPQEFVNWYLIAIESTELLTISQAKN